MALIDSLLIRHKENLTSAKEAFNVIEKAKLPIFEESADYEIPEKGGFKGSLKIEIRSKGIGTNHGEIIHDDLIITILRESSTRSDGLVGSFTIQEANALYKLLKKLFKDK
jgi:hypothetical protein